MKNWFGVFIIWAVFIYLIGIGPVFALPPYGFLKKDPPAPAPTPPKEGDACTVPSPTPKSTSYTLQGEPLACSLSQWESGYDVDGEVCKMGDDVPTSLKDEIQQSMLTYIDETNPIFVNKTAVLSTPIDTFSNGYLNAGCVGTDGTIDSRCTSQFIDYCDNHPTDTPVVGVSVNCETIVGTTGQSCGNPCKSDPSFPVCKTTKTSEKSFCSVV